MMIGKKRADMILKDWEIGYDDGAMNRLQKAKEEL